MTTMNEDDDGRLHNRVHAIGDAIAKRFEVGDAQTFVPVRARRFIVTITVAVVAAAILMAAAVVASRGGGTATTRVAAVSGVLDGLKIGGLLMTPLLSTSRGLVVVANFDDVHGGHPTVYAPSHDGM